MTKSARLSYIYISFYILISICVFSISWFSWWIRFYASICGYWLIFYLFHFIWKKMRGKEHLWPLLFIPLFLRKIAFGICLMVLIMWWFTLYHNIFFPAKLPLITLSNWIQTIQFQTMSHIASKRFYRKVQNSLTIAKQDWYVLYYEWVRPGNKENTAAFNAALGIDFNPELYKNLSKLYGVTAQDNNDFLWRINNYDFNIDISIDDIMALYNVGSKVGISDTSRTNDVYDINSQIIRQLSTLKPRELTLLRFINQSFLNFIMKNETFRNTIISKVWNTDLFSVILDDRNTHIVQEISRRNDEKVFLMYWLMHFNGIFTLLKEIDSNWEIIDTKNYQVLYPL